MGSLRNVGLEFEESMSGWICAGKTDFLEGRITGQKEAATARIDVKVIIDELDDFLADPQHIAKLEGTFAFAPLGGTFPIESGTFNLFSIDPESGTRQMVYTFNFCPGDERQFHFHGHKVIRDDPGDDMTVDMTTLFTTIYDGPDRSAPVYGAGQIFFDLRDSAKLLASMKVTGTIWLTEKARAQSAFLSFAWGVLRQEYFRDINPLYDTEYENLTLSGKVLLDGNQQDFFLVSGVHDRDFPWGDGEIFSDVLLLIGNPDDGYRKFAMTGRVLDGLRLNVGEGKYTYRGPLFEIPLGYSTSFSKLSAGDPDLIERRAEFNIRFDASPFQITPFPFLTANDVLARMTSGLKWTLRSILPSEHLMGIFITPHTVSVSEGTLKISNGDWEAEHLVEADRTFGEAESSTIRNIREPTLLYGYICSLDPDERTARVQIHANSLRNERQRLAKDQVDAFLGAAICRVTSKELLMENDQLSINDIDRTGGVPPCERLGLPLLEVNNDHFPTAVFQRRIIRVRDGGGRECLALEEDMNLMRLEAENSKKETIVAAIRNADKFRALDLTLEKSGFLNQVTARLDACGKFKEDFSIVIKPNFMFAYNKNDHTTYTDPQLVEHLVHTLRHRGGFKNISVVEAQSTYGEYFDGRSVPEVADYLGFAIDGSRGYKVVDLTTDQWEREFLGPHLGMHPVPRTWKNADYRISFAKNKTHAYAYYTLTLKNIYGALPLADKFSEYHTGRDIYHTTIEYLRAYPVHFGLIDAHSSADGPFGIFADSEPNITETIIGGESLVAVDWVGASKMGIQPKISQYMELAIKAFGKPEIELIGDPNPYRPWLNVPVALSMFTHFGLDASDYFGNLIYMAGAYMDESQFTHKSSSLFMKAARKALRPLQESIFLQAGGEQTMANRLVGRFLTWLGSH